MPASSLPRAAAPDEPRAPSIASLASRLARLGRALDGRFLGKNEAVRLLLIAALAGEHAVLIGPPGTAKSALVRTFAGLLRARYFEYLLTRFTEPNEIFGPVDIASFREGRYERRTEGMLPEAEIVLLDEVFKSSSAILNALLTILNERRFASGGRVVTVPLISAFGAANEVPTDDALVAVYDRFLLRIRSDNLDAYHFDELLQKGLENELALPPPHGPVAGDAPASPAAGGAAHLVEKPEVAVTAHELVNAQRGLLRHVQFGHEFFAQYKSLVFQIRAEGISLSDRRVVKLLKLFAASAFLDGRAQPDAGDFFVLKHVWNAEDQAPILDGIVTPLLEAHYRQHPDARRVGSTGTGVEALGAEIERVRQVLNGPSALGDIQLFSQLKALTEIKTTLSSLGDPRARELMSRVDQLLEAAFRGGRFSQP